MSKKTVTTIRTTLRRLEYARTISKKYGCKFKEKGSASFVFNYWIDEHAKKHGVDLD
jgi:hypothetical protein